MYSYYYARKELSSMFWNGDIDGMDMLVMEHLLMCLIGEAV